MAAAPEATARAALPFSRAAILLSKFGYLPSQQILIVALSLGIAVLILVRGITVKTKKIKHEKNTEESNSTEEK